MFFVYGNQRHISCRSRKREKNKFTDSTTAISTARQRRELREKGERSLLKQLAVSGSSYPLIAVNHSNGGANEFVRQEAKRNGNQSDFIKSRRGRNWRSQANTRRQPDNAIEPCERCFARSINVRPVRLGSYVCRGRRVLDFISIIKMEFSSGSTKRRHHFLYSSKEKSKWRKGKQRI